jgi:hypothetical protein
MVARPRLGVPEREVAGRCNDDEEADAGRLVWMGGRRTLKPPGVWGRDMAEGEEGL